MSEYPKIDGELVHAIVHAAAIEALNAGQTFDAAACAEKAKKTVETLSEPEKKDIGSRLRIQRLLAGKDLRREVQENSTDTALLVRELSQETRGFLEAFIAENSDDIVHATRAHAEKILSPDRTEKLQAMALSPERLYQEVIGVSFDRAKAACGKPNATKWIDLIAPVFKQGKALQLLEALGYLPHELYSSETFRRKIDFVDLAGLHQGLKQRETDEKGLPRERTLHARAQLLSQLFLSDIAKKADGKVTIDVNGLWVNLEQRRGRDVQARLHAHLPYEYASEELLAAMKEQGWLQETDIAEARLRRAEAMHDPIASEEAERVKIRQFLDQTGFSKFHDYKDKTIDEIIDRMSFDFVVMARFDESPSFARFPLSIVRHHLQEPLGRAHVLRNVLGLAEAIQSHVAKDSTYRHAPGYASYDLTTIARESYDLRKSILNDPRQYDVPRIIGLLLESLEKIEPMKVPYQLFRGTIKEGEQQNHSFLEIMTQEGGFHRVLIDPGKQLTNKQQELFHQIPELERSEHELFETLALTHRHYQRLNRDMTELDGPRGDYLSGERLREAFLSMMQDMNGFLMIEDPEKFPFMMQLYGKFLQNPEQVYPSYYYLKFAREAVAKFGEKLFEPDIHATLESFSGKMQRKEIAFDEGFLDGFPERFKKNSWTSDPALTAQLAALDQTITVMEAGDRDIPYAMEAKAIRSLRLLPDRPLICVIGGCRDLPQVGEERVSAVDRMCEGITTIANTLKANVVPPGTQSGIGVNLGRASVAYQQRMAALPPGERARFFAVSPGGETYYPGNPHLAPESEKEAMAYAIGPFDSILTPFQAGWDWTGERKRDAPYFRHVEYAEAIYNRVSAGQPRITIVGNGGLFTIVEAVAALKNKSSIVLVEDTGRFADLAIALRKEAAVLEGDGWEQRVIDCISRNIPSHSQKALFQAFGSDANVATPEQQLYREKLREYLVLSANADVRTTSVATLEDTVQKAVDDWRAKHEKKK